MQALSFSTEDEALFMTMGHYQSSVLLTLHNINKQKVHFIRLASLDNCISPRRSYLFFVHPLVPSPVFLELRPRPERS